MAEDTTRTTAQLLREAGMSPEDIAARTGASVRSVYRWIEGRRALGVFERALCELAEGVRAR